MNRREATLILQLKYGTNFLPRSLRLMESGNADLMGVVIVSDNCPRM